MRYGIFSDIHSNLEALESVLRAYLSEDIDRYFCVGDVVGYGADPAECVRRIRELPALTVAGNHDWAVAGLLGTEAFNPQAREAVRWNRERSDPPGLKFLESLHLVHTEGPVTLVHGTLEAPADFMYLFDEKDAQETFDAMETQLCFVGHTHLAGIFSRGRDGRVNRERVDSLALDEGRRYIVNVGSVGQPRDGDARAAYCVFDLGAAKVEIKRIGYDVEAARRKIIDAGLPEFLGERLLYGR